MGGSRAYFEANVFRRPFPDRYPDLRSSTRPIAYQPTLSTDNRTDKKTDVRAATDLPHPLSVDGMKKIRTKTSSDQRLVKRCEKETGKTCSNPKWQDFNDLAQYEPGPDTAILLVDMHLKSGERKAVYIHDSNDEQVDMVGMEYKGFTSS
ncbi:hypothetical protein CGGC5_v011017 [Colletotrichum fructicola Nara gc5]|uniref:Uncharacterized protein n=1 Tax=Colletotrichum fructicola (strain Nara gc5) TaxID=1213859 RepID=A0A7J6IWW6_COLFN|nr:hypothetical protein CFRS1_v015352 [Colletotrichum fructicola]KAF4481558.1 hypothetical protein CGGC5_v011017 [Colletotrichum fructicola Nara gc5]